VANCASTVFAINLAKYYVKKANIIEQCRKKRKLVRRTGMSHHVTLEMTKLSIKWGKGHKAFFDLEKLMIAFI